MQTLLAEQQAQEKKKAVTRVLWQILGLNVLVAVSKIVVGTLTGTVAIVADGLHSTVDSTSNIIALVAQRFSAQPPDADHPYGHDKYETLATLAIGGLLLVTAWEVLRVALSNLKSGKVPEIGAIQFAVLIITLIINLGVTTYERGKAKTLDSDLLASDAAHTLSDVWVTISVIIGLIAVKLGVAWMDSVVALAIVVLIAYTGWQIIRKTSRILVDAAPISAEALSQVVRGVSGVQKVLQARSRGVKEAVHVDLDLQLAHVISTELAHTIADAVRENLMQAFPNISEVHIQIVPDSDSKTDYLTLARVAADKLGLGVHELIGVNTPQGGKILELHVEVPAGLTLQEAHDLIGVLEKHILEHPDIVEVVTHIEPAASGQAILTQSPEALALQDTMMHRLNEHFPQGYWHHPNVHRNGHGFIFTAHYKLPGEMSVETAHQFAEEAELYLRSNFPQLQRVTIHTEPE